MIMLAAPWPCERLLPSCSVGVCVQRGMASAQLQYSMGVASAEWVCGLVEFGGGHRGVNCTVWHIWVTFESSEPAPIWCASYLLEC